jgi:hypothetical protein
MSHSQNDAVDGSSAYMTALDKVLEHIDSAEKGKFTTCGG